MKAGEKDAEMADAYAPSVNGVSTSVKISASYLGVLPRLADLDNVRRSVAATTHVSLQVYIAKVFKSPMGGRNRVDLCKLLLTNG